MKQTFTYHEVLALLIKERKAAVDLCYQVMEEFEEKEKNQRFAKNEYAFISREIANECRLIGNAISGGNALSAALGETMEDRVKEELDKVV